MKGYSYCLSPEMCNKCDEATLHIITVTEDTKQMTACLRFTCTQCSDLLIKHLTLKQYVGSVREQLPNLTICNDRNWWLQPIR